MAGQWACKALALVLFSVLGAGPLLADPPSISQQPENLTNCPGATAIFQVAANGLDPLGYQWYQSGTNAIVGATNSTLVISNVQASDSASYSVVVMNGDASGSITSAPALLVVNGLITASGPTDLAVCANTPATFSASAAGPDPLTYQWWKDGNILAAYTDSSITLFEVTEADAGNYCVVVSGACASVTNCATLTVLPAAAITASGPTDLAVCAGAPATFSISAAGPDPLTYQWWKDGNVLAGYTGSSITITQVTLPDAGNYCVVVSGVCASVTNCAALTVLAPPVITGQPNNLTTVAGTEAALNVSASGAMPLSYQWQHNGSNVDGATSARLTIPNAQLADAGAYTVVVTGDCGAITSQMATLLITPAPVILIETDAIWSYLDYGRDQYTSWRRIDLDDSGWATGPADLGYGTNYEGQPVATTVSYGPDPANKYITTYFRNTFVLTNLAGLSNLTLTLRSLDGGVVYLNYFEAYRNLMPAGPVAYTNLALPAPPPEHGESPYLSRTLDPAVLTLYEGTNWIAVETHLSSVTNANMSFGLKLAAHYGELLPTVPSLTRGPYLQVGMPTGVTIRWRTDLTTDSQVEYGLDPGNLTDFAADDAVTTEHIVALAGLLPDTKYYYAVGASGTNFASGADYFFVTAPDGPKPTRVWVIGDSGTATLVGGNSEGVRDAYAAFAGGRYTDLWLMLGDNAYYEGTDAQYQTAVFNTYPEMLRQTVLWPTIGNHETYDPYSDGHIAYNDIFTLPTRAEAGGLPSGTQNYYSFDYGNIHFVCLDSELSDPSPNGPMLTWLKHDLAANTNDWLIAFWHSPPYSHGSHDSDDPYAWPQVLMRQNAVPILESYGVDLVLCGHSHNYERSFLLDGHYGFSGTLVPSMIKDAGSGRPEDTGAYIKSGVGPAPRQGAVYTVCGSSGWVTYGGTMDHPVMYKSLLQTGSLVLDIDGNRLDAKFLRETGAIDDFFTILKGVPPEPLRVASFRVSTNTVWAKWKSIAGQTYRLEKAEALPGPWSDLSGPVTATGATTSWISPVSSGSTNCFYRVVEIQP